MAPDKLTPKQPVAPIEYTRDLSCPLLGLFGEDDQNPTPTDVAQLEQALKAHGKNYSFHMYPKAGHGFFYYHRPGYRQEPAVDGWMKLFAFLETYLQTPAASEPAAQ
jgi:carboxymethylenebutenolidase